MKDQSLDEIRKKINQVDEEILSLISQRVDLGRHVANAKQKHDSVYFRPDRERQVMQRLTEINPGILDNVRVQNIFREIMSATLSMQKQLQVGYLGPIGSFSHQAAIKKFGHSLKLVPCADFEDVFEQVQKKKIDYGIVPIENSLEGIVNATLDNLLKYNLNIYSEVHLAIHNNLLSFAEEISQIKTIYTYRQPYGQCRQWIGKYLPHAEFIETTSTSKAAELIAQKKDPALAAIASSIAAEIYKIPILEENIEDYDRNFTRFIIIGFEEARASDLDRTSIMFSIHHEPGSLFEVLEPLYRAKVNMTSIESRPARKEPWNYTFYIDLIGHQENEPLKGILEQIKNKTLFFRILGSYPVDQDFS
ncbi:MAG: prephenate dehydratase [Spirochaetia bacterium]|nr:prephenate dehydratase [Spirochaetia bacterium]